MNSFKVKVAAACAAAVVFLHAVKAVDQSNVISTIADKAAELIQFAVKFLLAA